MSFGKNPYLAKAEAAELKAEEATDEASQVRAYRDAAHQWDRAAEREKPGKKRAEYEANAARNRALAEDFATRNTDPVDAAATRNTEPLEPPAARPAEPREPAPKSGSNTRLLN